MQKSKFLFLFFFCACFCFCFCFYADSEIVQSTLNITIAGKVKYSGPDLTITAPIPIESVNQKISGVYSTYPYEISDGSIIFHPKGDYVINIIVKKNFSGVLNVSHKTSAYSDEFLKNTGLTAWNNEIREKAEEIAVGENDLIKAAKIAKYVHDTIKYDVSVDLMPSIWVFENKRGKCSELADLFISMCRSVGISARAVNGFACSSRCERHGWAEVFIGGNWIEVDPTFMQIPADASHVVFSRSYACQKMQTNVKWVGGIVEHENEVSGEIIENFSENFFDFEIVNEKLIGQNSTLPVSVLIKNNADFHVAGFCRILVKDLKDEEQIFYLMPDSASKINFNITIPRMDENYIYNYGLLVKCSSINKTSDFKVDGRKYGNINTGVIISDADISKKTVFLENNGLNDLNTSIEICTITGTERKCEKNEINLKAKEKYAYNYSLILPKGNFTLEIIAKTKSSEDRKKIFIENSENHFEDLNKILPILLAAIVLLSFAVLFKLNKRNR